MKRTLVAMALLAAAALVGCGSDSKTGGRAGTDTFHLSAPTLSIAVKQGETQLVRVTVERGEGFKQAVKLQTRTPSGIEVDPDGTTVRPGDKGDVQLKISATKDAPLGDQKIMLKGTPEKGDSADLEFKVTVSAK